MTSLGFPFTVDHDTNYVTFAGNVGGVPQNWHVEYCKGNSQPLSPEDLGYEPGWHAEYYFFPGVGTGNEGYFPKAKADYATVDAEINFPNLYTWNQGKHPK